MASLRAQLQPHKGRSLYGRKKSSVYTIYSSCKESEKTQLHVFSHFPLSFCLFVNFVLERGNARGNGRWKMQGFLYPPSNIYILTRESFIDSEIFTPFEISNMDERLFVLLK